MMTQHDRSVIRELAKRCLDIAENPVNRARIERIKDNNSLVPGRPPVWVDEVPWHEMNVNGELDNHCESEAARDIETRLLRVMFQWKYFQGDMVVEPFYYITKSFSTSGFGIAIKEQTLSLDGGLNHVQSHHYEDQIDSEEKVALLRSPVVTATPDIDAARVAEAEDALGGILPVKLRGNQMFYPPWDDIAEYRGVEPILYDFIERPRFLHLLAKTFNELLTAQYEQMEAQNLLDYNIPSLHGTPHYTHELPSKDFDGTQVKLKDMWFRGMAQPLLMVSPEMRNEFDIEYMKPMMERCGLSYYGCCEPLEKALPFLRRVKNLRKITVTPWADIASCCEQIGGDYVVARKSNPANLALGFDTEVIEKETRETVELCIKNKCPYEFVLKDITTVDHKPQHLFEWMKTVTGVLDSYY